jgi:HAD superfamily hydrolase (TIGR01509 family)
MIKDQTHLICFDLDGVLISSMAIANRIFYEVVQRELGLPLYDYPQRKDLMALSVEERLESLWENEMKERGITEKQIAHALHTFQTEKLSAGIPILPHAAKAVKLMADHFEFLACVSSNADYVIKETLVEMSLRPYFSFIAGMDEVAFSKPHPAIYQHAVSHFGLNPKDCLTFEDSTHGIHSAKAAGLKAIALATGLESMEELKKSGANLVWPDLSGISLEKIMALF